MTASIQTWSLRQLYRAAEAYPDQVAAKATGSNSGWWGASEEVESFLDELITWRELGYNMCWQRDDYDQYESLPQWAQQTLDDHAKDDRPHVYTLEQFENAEGLHQDLRGQRQTATIVVRLKRV